MKGVATAAATKRAIRVKRHKARKSYYVYILLCDDGSYYTGYTNNMASRLEKHKRGSGARYTRTRRPKAVVYVEKFKARRAAIKREREIKALSHREKHELVSIGSDAHRSPNGYLP